MWGQETLLLLLPNHLSSYWLLKSWQRERLRGGKRWRQTEAGRTAKKLSVGFSMAALAFLVSPPVCLRDWQSPQPTLNYPRQSCRIILTASKRRSTWWPRACCQEASGQDSLPTETSPCQSEPSLHTSSKIRLFAMSQAND